MVEAAPMRARERRVSAILDRIGRFPVVALIGARQVGKTTLAAQVAAARPGRVVRFDLENPVDLGKLEDPMRVLEPLRGLVIIDEIQRRPDLFPVLRVLSDRPRKPARFLVLGSASPDLLRQGSETLAGRIRYLPIEGFSLDEIRPSENRRLWIRGGFPRSFLARSDRDSVDWRNSFVQTFLERDLPQLGFRVAATTLHRFWSMLAHWHGQVWNASEFARSFGVSDVSVRQYLDALAGTFVVRILAPWFENVGKRQVKSPKVYVADSGLLHALLGLASHGDLETHPKIGASWEGFMLGQVAARLGARPEECFFWRTQQGAELDLLVVRGRRRLGFEFKHTRVPEVTRSMKIAVADLGLDRLDVVFLGHETWEMGERIRAVGSDRILDEIHPF